MDGAAVEALPTGAAVVEGLVAGKSGETIGGLDGTAVDALPTGAAAVEGGVPGTNDRKSHF